MFIYQLEGNVYRNNKFQEENNSTSNVSEMKLES